VTCAGLVLGAYLVRYYDLSVDEAMQQVRVVVPIAMSAPGYEPMARRFAEQEAGRDDAQG
jgi:protein-tyrosine phosphatase